MPSLAVLPCHVQPSTVQVCPCVPLRARIVQEIRQMHSGRLVFPRLTSYHLPMTLSRSTTVLPSPPTRSGREFYELAHVGVGYTPYWLGLLRVRLDVSSSFASQRSRGKEGL